MQKTNQIHQPIKKGTVTLAGGDAYGVAEAHDLDLPMVSGLGKYATDHDGATPERLTNITFDEVRALVDAPQQGVDKDRAQWLIPSTHQSRKNHDKNGVRPLLWADIDDPKGRTIEQTAEVLQDMLGNCDFEVYASRSAKADRQKCRILIPLAQALQAKEWLVAAEVFRTKLGEAGIESDPASEKLGQVLYLPNRGEFYDSASSRGGDLFEPLAGWAHEIKQRQEEIERQAKTTKAAQEAARKRREALVASRSASGFKSPIEAFNAAFDVTDILIRNGYAQRGDTFRHPASQTGSYSAHVKADAGGVRRVHSLSTSDPLHTNGQGAHDAFSAFCVLEHGGNRDAAIRDAGDNHLSIGGESFNKVQRREYSQQKQQQRQHVVERERIFQVDSDTGEMLEEEPRRGLLRPVSIADVLTNPQPPHPFAWGPYVPCEALTLLSAHGGIGKSAFGLQLAAHVALGRDFLGHPTKKTNALFFSAEDGTSILRLRIASVCRSHEIEPAQLAQHLHVLDALDASLLWSTDRLNGPGDTTEHYSELAAYIAQHDIGFLVVDNASDTYGGDRNDKSAVTQFVRALVRMVRANGGAVLLLSHVNRTTASKSLQSTGSYSDSVAWHNAARSRLFLEGDKGTHLKTLKHEKCNYGPEAEDLTLVTLPGGCGLALAHEDQALGRQSEEAANTVTVLGLIRRLYERGIYISTSRSAGNAFTVLETQPDFPRSMDKRAFWSLMDKAEHRGQLKRERYTNADRKTRERWSAPVL